jgi:hypothetical protein
MKPSHEEDNLMNMISHSAMQNRDDGNSTYMPYQRIKLSTRQQRMLVPTSQSKRGNPGCSESGGDPCDYGNMGHEP